MDWKYAKMLLVSTATVAVASQVVKNVYKYFFRSPTSQISSKITDITFKALTRKNREINDVLVFSDEIVHDNAISHPIRKISTYKLIKYIKSTRETLDVCMYLITSSEIAEELIRLGQKHVLVRIIVDSEMANTPPSQIQRLQEYSFIQVQTSKRAILMHHKFCIIDGPKAVKRKNILKSYVEKLNVHGQFNLSNNKRNIRNKPLKGFVMLGSLNWSTQAMGSNNESVIVTSQQLIVEKLEKGFETLWEENEPALLMAQN